MRACAQLGNTIHFTDHGDAYAFFHASNNEDMATKAGAAGYDSIQFLAHSDCEFKTCRKAGMSSLNYEIVATSKTKLAGKYSCTTPTGTYPSGQIKKGWHSDTCTCNNNQNNLNCQGVPIKPVGDASC